MFQVVRMSASQPPAWVQLSHQETPWTLKMIFARCFAGRSAMGAMQRGKYETEFTQPRLKKVQWRPCPENEATVGAKTTTTYLQGVQN